jgi:hypothetical protein
MKNLFDISSRFHTALVGIRRFRRRNFITSRRFEGGGEEVNLQWQGWHKRRFEDHVQIKGTEMRRERERENGGEFKHPHSHFFPRGCFFFILAIVPHFWIKYLSFILVFLFFRKRGVRESEWVGPYRRSSTITERRNRLKNFKNINRIKLQTQRHIIFDGC